MNTNYRRPRRRGFSLIEILVVVGILVTLLGVAALYLSKARKTAARTRQASDFQAIAMALDAYKQDHGDYPRPFGRGTGVAVLGQALIAPGPKAHDPANGINFPPNAFQTGEHYGGGEVVYQGTTTYVSIAHNEAGAAPATPSDFWSVAPWGDSADGPGFRLRPQGQTYGPYLQPDKFKLKGYAILDLWGNPILYFPARAGSVNINNPRSFMWDTRDTTLPLSRPLYDYVDNVGMLGGTASNNTAENKADMAPFLHLLGDFNPNNPAAATNANGQIDGGESANHTGPFILWSAGPDAEDNHDFHYGLVDSQGQPDPNGKTDDIANFDIPVGFLKK